VVKILVAQAEEVPQVTVHPANSMAIQEVDQVVLQAVNVDLHQDTQLLREEVVDQEAHQTGKDQVRALETCSEILTHRTLSESDYVNYINCYNT